MNEQLMQMMQQFSSQNVHNSGLTDQNAMMMQMLEQLKTKKPTEDNNKRHVKMVKTLRKNKNVIRSLTHQLQLAGEFIGQFADLVGACPHCLGQVDECEHCHGEGGPGYRQPDADLMRWIRPAINYLENTNKAKLTNTH